MTGYEGITRRGLVFGAPGVLLGVEVLAQDGAKEYKKDFGSPKATLETFLAAITAGDIKGTHEMFAQEKVRFGSGRQLPDDHGELYDLVMITLTAPTRITFADTMLERTIAGGGVDKVVTAPLTYEDGLEKFPGRHYVLPQGGATALGRVSIWYDFHKKGEIQYRNSVQFYVFLAQAGDHWKIKAIDDYAGFVLGFKLI